MTVGKIYEKIQKIEELKNLRESLIGSKYFASLFLGKEVLNYINEHHNIPITEKSTDSDIDLHKRIEEINNQIDSLMKTEI